MELIFNTHGNEKQKECARAWVDPTVNEIIYGGSKGSAKSFTGCSLIFGSAFLYPESHWFIARKKLNDLRKFTVPSIYEVFDIWKLDKRYYNFNAVDNMFTLHNGAKVFLIEAKFLPSDPHFMRFGSMQMTGGWIEEAGEFEHEAKSNLQASIGRWKNDLYQLPGKLLMTCNPSKNFLYQDYKKNKIGQLEPYKRLIQALPGDNKRLPKGYLENLERTLSSSAKQRLLFGNWEFDDSPDILCNYEAIVDIFKNSHVPEGEKFITADIARFGSDKAIIATWSGWRVIEFTVFEKSDMTTLQNAIVALRTKYQVPTRNIIADEDGIGGGVVDNLQIKGFVNNARPIDGENDPITGKPKKENYYNLQSQCGFKLAEKINSSQLFIQCDLSQKHREEITEELEQLRSFQNDGHNPLRILPKEQIKDNIGRSPDWRDSLLMRAFFEFNPIKKIKYTVR